jgi:hypothetical protein
MNIKNKLVTILLLYFITPNYATADELYLKNSDRITGQVIELSTTHCTFKTDYQATLHIKRSDIVRLNITPPVASDDTASLLWTFRKINSLVVPNIFRRVYKRQNMIIVRPHPGPL